MRICSKCGVTDASRRFPKSGRLCSRCTAERVKASIDKRKPYYLWKWQQKRRLDAIRVQLEAEEECLKTSTG